MFFGVLTIKLLSLFCLVTTKEQSVYLMNQARYFVYFVREQICSGKMMLKYLPTAVMVADVLTKGLPRVPFVQIWKLLFGSAF